MVVTIAGILPNLSWEEIAERLNLSALSVLDQCMDKLELSYRKLADYLRSCLLYFGAFPVDKEIHFRGLIWLWIAEGFVKTGESKSLEDVALDYMNDLICRSLVMVSKERSTGGIKTCRLHDLLHEFCVVKAKKEKFLSILSGHDELVSFRGQSDLQRLCLYSTTEHFKKSRLSCPGVRSLLLFADDKYQFQHFHISFIFHQFVLLEVLDLMPINVGSTFPSEIALLVHLRYLAINGEFCSIPSAVANLLNLETLIVCANEVFLPDTIWNMLKLRVLYLPGSWFFYSCLAKENLERSPNLDNLDTFSTLELSFGPNIEKIMTKLPNIRRLNFRLLGSGECNADWNRIVTMDFLSRLESLHLTQPEAGIGDCRSFRFHFPRNLKKLTLSNFHSSIIPKSDGLSSLVAFKLSRIYFEGDIWDMKENWELPELKFLELRSLSIVRSTGFNGDVNFPRLQKLLLEDCWNLKVVPSCLGDITALQMIEMHDCPESVASLFLKIKKEQKNNWGNEDLQVLTSNG